MAALAALPETERAAALEALVRLAEEQFRQLPPEQQAEALRQAQEQQIAAVADQTANAVREALAQSDRDTREELAARLIAAADHYAAGETPGSPYDQLAAFLRACAAVLRGEPPPPVPERYVGRFQALSAGAASHDETDA